MKINFLKNKNKKIFFLKKNNVVHNKTCKVNIDYKFNQI